MSFLLPTGYRSSTCGYCSSPGQRSVAPSFHSVGLSALSLTCKDYQSMIDRGWRRSGTYCYKPDMRQTCCPQYTIRLDALELSPSRSMRKTINRWNHFVMFGGHEQASPTAKGEKRIKSKAAKSTNDLSFIESIHAAESTSCEQQTVPKHAFEVILEPSSYTEEKYELFRTYQLNIHSDDRSTPSGFSRFLVESPLTTEQIPYTKPPPPNLPQNYGSYHQLYRLNGELIAMAVLDILPECVSSVYFMYNPRWERFSFGKLSALREAALAREMHDCGIPGLRYLYMGFYIHSCPKMKYKGEYSPSYLLDPEEYSWHPLKDCMPLLDQYHYACFSNPEHSLANDVSPPELDQIPTVNVSSILVTENGRDLSLIYNSPVWRNNRTRHNYVQCIDNLGHELSKQVVFLF